MSDQDNEELGSKDMELYWEWKRDPNPRNMSKLLKSLGPLISREVSRASGTLPDSALRGEAKIWAIKAVKTFDPGKNVKLSTHVTNYVQKVRRMNYQHQNVARLPENKQIQYREYTDSIHNLESELGRSPTDEELAKYLGWSKKHTVQYGKMLRKDFPESQGEAREDSVHHQVDRKALFLAELHKTLTPDEARLARLLEQGVTTNSKLQEALGGMPLSTLSLLKKNIRDKAERQKSLL